MPVEGDMLLQNGVQAVVEHCAQVSDVRPCQVSFHRCNLLHPDADERQKNKDDVVRLIPLVEQLALAFQLPTLPIVISAGNYQADQYGEASVENWKDAARKELAKELAEVSQLSSAHNVRIALEPYIKSVIQNPESFTEVAGLVSNTALGCVVDVSNWYDFRDMIEPSMMVARAADLFQDDWNLIHVKDIGLTPGFHIQAGLVPVLQGPTPWPELLAPLKNNPNADTLILIEHCADVAEAEATFEHITNILDGFGLAWMA